jgi:hypothetical protein
VNATRTHDERKFAVAGPDDCPAICGGMAGYWLCERTRGHAGWHRDTEPDGRIWAWESAREIAGCVPDENAGLTGHYERPDCDHG